MDKSRIAVLSGGLVVAGVAIGFADTAVACPGAPSAEEVCEALRPKRMGPSVRSGEEAPDFEFTDIAGKKWSLRALRGRPVVLGFWATWCAPCAKEIPALEKLSRSFGDRLTVLTVSIDESSETVKKFFPTGTTLPVLLDSQKEISKRFGTEKVPETFLIDSAGRVQQLFYQAPWDGAEAERCLASLR